MNILTALSVLAFSSVPAVDSELPEFQYNGSGLALIAPFDSGIIAVTWGYGSVLYLERGSTARSVPWPWDESMYCSAPSSYESSAVICMNYSGLDYILLFSRYSVLEVYGPFLKSGRPVFDSMGNLWFTADGFLYRNGISTGTELESHTVSVDPAGNRAVFCDSGDRICILNVAGGESSVLASGYRFYNPAFVTCEGTPVIISPTLEGEIIQVSPSDGSCTSLATGSQPFWWKEREALLFTVTFDDGHQITSGEIWTISLDGVSQQITFSPDIHEIHPIAIDGAIYAIDAITGSLITVQER
ncbi:MAG: hypothetical protein K8S24_01820 [Candidatus Aegiribacteria sp.]|nr:hypothetical protein [Candidatus Aegiribacteria sp.]